MERLTPEISKQLRSCAKAPGLDGVDTQQDVAVKITEYAIAHQDCEAKLGAVDEILTALERETEPSAAETNRLSERLFPQTEISHK